MVGKANEHHPIPAHGHADPIPAPVPAQGHPAHPHHDSHVHHRQSNAQHGHEFQAANPGVVLMAYLALKKPKNIRMRYLIPKDRAAWLDFQVRLVKTKAHIKYLTDREISKVIIRARKNIAPKEIEYFHDPDLPKCFDWTEEQVAEWVDHVGFPQFKHAFLLNHITGKRLIDVDASALNKMGIQYFDDIKAVAQKIRELLQIHSPNLLRALMRKVPFEIYLKKRRYTGRTYDQLTFEDFCDQSGFPYYVLEKNKCALIEPTTDIIIKAADAPRDSSDEEDGGSENELMGAPSVEFTVNHILIRNRTVQDILDSLIETVFIKPETPPTTTDEKKKMISDILMKSMSELGLDEEAYQERIDFAKQIAYEMVKEVKRTAEIIGDIGQFRKNLNIEEKIASDQEMIYIKVIAQHFLTEAQAIAVLLATGQLELENIFRQEPEFIDFVGEVAEEAEQRIEAIIPPSKRFVDEVLFEAKKRILKQEFPALDLGAVETVKTLAMRFVDKLFSGECDPNNMDKCEIEIFSEDVFEALYDPDPTLEDSTTLFIDPEVEAARKREYERKRFSRRFRVSPKSRPTRSRDKPKKTQSLNAKKQVVINENPDVPVPVPIAKEEEQTDNEERTSDLESDAIAGQNETEAEEISNSRRKSSGESGGDGTPISSPTTHGSSGDLDDSDGKRKISALLDKMSLPGETAGSSAGEGVQHHVAFAKVEYDSSSSNQEKKPLRKFTLTTATSRSNPQSSSTDDQRKSKTAKDIWEDIEAMKILERRKEESDINASTPQRKESSISHTVQHDASFLLKEKRHRADFDERWAEQEHLLDNETLSGSSRQAHSVDHNARIAKMTADRIVSDVFQMALTHLLLKAESGQDSHSIMAALRKLKPPEDTPKVIEQPKPSRRILPLPQQKEIPRLTGRDPRGTLSTGLYGWPDDKMPGKPELPAHSPAQCRPPPVKLPEARPNAGTTKESVASPLGQPINRQQEQENCENVVCYHPFFQNWRVN